MAEDVSTRVTLASYQISYSENEEGSRCILIVSAPEGKQIRKCEAAELRISDEKGKVLDYTEEKSRSEEDKRPNRKIFSLFLPHAPDGDNLRIEGNVNVTLAWGEEKHPAETVAYGEEKKLVCEGEEITFLPMPDEPPSLFHIEEQLQGIRYRLKDGSRIKEMEWLSADGSPLRVVMNVNMFRPGVGKVSSAVLVPARPGDKVFQVRVTTYEEVTEESVPVRLNLNLRNMQVTERQEEENELTQSRR